jgi:hypothetical protein
MSFDPRRLGASVRELEDVQQRQRAEELRQPDRIAQNREAAARYARRGRDQARRDFLADNDPTSRAGLAADGIERSGASPGGIALDALRAELAEMAA